MYWSLLGEQEGGTSRHAGQTETFGVLNHCNTAPAAQVRRLARPHSPCQAHINALQRLMGKTELEV